MKYAIYVLLILLSQPLAAQQLKKAASSPDETQIRENRRASNAAIEAQDTSGIARHWSPEIFVLTSRNAQNVGRRQNAEAFSSEFKTRQGLIYIRTPHQVETSASTFMASEAGTWVGRWKNDAESIEVSGTYYAKWIKSGNRWLIRAEVYTLLNCQGDSFCKTMNR
jgi:ketosteroid isomerase-like protein